MDPDSSGASRESRVARRGLRIAITDHLGVPLRAPGLEAWLTRTAPVSVRGEVTVALVSDARIRALNRRFRGKNTATDVLSFPEDAPRGSRLASRLGDIVISTHSARRQARDGGHPYATELKILALHGLLHLLGYDHDSPDDGGRMARVERRLRAKGGLPAGLIERASTTSAPRARIRPRAGGAAADAARRQPARRSLKNEGAKRRARARAGESEGPRPLVEK